MFFKKLTEFFSSGQIDESPSHLNEAPPRIDVTKLPLFEQVDPAVRYMVNEYQQFIREHITFINHWVNEKQYNSAASMFIRLKWADFYNSEIPRFEQNTILMSVVETLPQQPDSKKLHCPFRRIGSDLRSGKDMFELTDCGYKDIVTSSGMPNRAYGLGESWRTREKASDDESYYNTAREVLFYYYLVGFDNVRHEQFRKPEQQ